MAQGSKESKNLPVRPDKTIDWLNKSRDDWKNKSQAAKAELKVAKQAQRRARESRQEWKEEYRQLERQFAMVMTEKDAENATLKTKVQELERENEDLKKKYLLHLMTKK
jgi:chromosome segregation ATPase